MRERIHAGRAGTEEGRDMTRLWRSVLMLTAMLALGAWLAGCAEVVSLLYRCGPER